MPGILIVEDREMISNVISDMLRLNGLIVAGFAKDGREALELYRNSEPDLVLMDLLLPDMSGLEVSKKILAEDPEAKIIAITAMTKEELDEECEEIGLRRLVRKPFRMGELMAVIKEVLEE
ncbi:MAG: response regulator [Thermoplasmatota archaeon]